MHSPSHPSIAILPSVHIASALVRLFSSARTYYVVHHPLVHSTIWSAIEEWFYYPAICYALSLPVIRRRHRRIILAWIRVQCECARDWIIVGWWALPHISQSTDAYGGLLHKVCHHPPAVVVVRSFGVHMQWNGNWDQFGIHTVHSLPASFNRSVRGEWSHAATACCLSSFSLIVAR